MKNRSSAPKLPSLMHHTAYYMVGRVATGLIGLLALVAFTRVLSPTDYGRYAVVIAVVGLIAGVGFQWLRQCLIRFGTGVGQRSPVLLGTLGALFLGLLALMVVVAALLVLVLERRILRIDLSAAEVACICCLVAAQAWFELTADAVRAEFRPVRYSVATLTRAVLSLVLGVIAALLTREVFVVVFAMAVAYMVASFVTVPRWFTGLLRLDIVEWEDVRRLAAYGLPLAGTLGMTFILDSADRLMLAAMRGYREAGVYSSAYNFSQYSIGTVLVGLGLGSLPLAVETFRRHNESGTARLLGNNLMFGIAIGLPAVVGLVILAPGLDRVLLGNYVAGRSDIVTMIVAVGIGLAAIRSYCVDVVFMLYQRTWLQAAVIGVAALLNVLLNLVFIPRWGAIGAASASLAAFLLAFLGSWFLSRQYLKIPVSLKEVAKILVSCVAMSFALVAISPNAGHWPRVVFGVTGGAAVYFLAAVALNVAGSRARLVALFLSRNTGG